MGTAAAVQDDSVRDRPDDDCQCPGKQPDHHCAGCLQRVRDHGQARPAAGLGRRVRHDQCRQVQRQRTGHLARHGSTPGQAHRQLSQASTCCRDRRRRTRSMRKKRPASWWSEGRAFSVACSTSAWVAALAALKIDGLTVTGGDSGGGILASGYACGLEVSNNRVVANYGTYGGGVRVGHTTLVNGTAYTDGVNRPPNIHHNWISQNGATEAGGGGGITLGTGSDSYVVTSNYICGNFSMADGGGMSHLGLSAGRRRLTQSPRKPDRQQQVHLQPDLQPGSGPDGCRPVHRWPGSARRRRGRRHGRRRSRRQPVPGQPGRSRGRWRRQHRQDADG